MDSKEIASQTIKSVSKYTTDNIDSWEKLAVKSIMYDLCDRRGIKDSMWRIDEATLEDMKSVWINIIRECSEKNEIPNQETNSSNTAG